MVKIIVTLLLLIISFSAHTQNKIRINSVKIIGNKITKEDIILREIVFKKNSVLTKSDLHHKIEESEQNLVNLQIFNFVKINHNISDNRADITIKLTERWYIWPTPVFEISERNFNSWWNNFKASNFTDFSRINYGIFLNWSNFRGKNEILKLKVRRGFKEHYLFSYQLPYLNKKKTIGISTNLQLFRREKSFYKSENNILVYHTDENKFTTEDYEFNATFTYRKAVNKTHHFKINYFFSYVDTAIINKNPGYLNSKSNYGSYTKLTYKFVNEKRDYISYPLNGYYFSFEGSKYINGKSNINHFEIVSKAEKHHEIKNRLFIGSSFKSKWSSNGYQPYYAQKGLGFEDYIRGYEYYVIDGQDFWISKSALKYTLVQKTNFTIPYIKMKQFNKVHYSLYLSVFSDLGYVVDEQTYSSNRLSNVLLWGNGFSLDYVTYYDRLVRIEFSVNYLGEKGVFLHFSNPF